MIDGEMIGLAWYLWILLVLLALCTLYLWLIAPARRRLDAGALRGWLYAHRGLHDGNVAVPENSLSAFRRAVEGGYGIELDTQLTRDGQVVVCHDSNLKRIAGADAEILSLTYDELCTIPLCDGSHVPLLSDVLALVAGRVPLIVEVKHYGGPARNAQKTWELLRAYQGPYCVESFHPLAVRYFRRNAPQVIRGQLAAGGRFAPGMIGRPAFFCMKHLLLNAVSRPDFVAYCAEQDHTLSMGLMKRLYRPLLAAWTIRDQPLMDRVQKQYDLPIFELFIPKR